MSNNWKPEPRLQWWKIGLGIAVFLFFMGLMGTMDLAAKREAQCTRKDMAYDWKNDKCVKEQGK
jgi:hypothetical protein